MSLITEPAPQPGYVTRCRVERVLDGDTLVVLIPERRIHVRLVGAWAPEKKDPGGLEAKAHLERLVAKSVDATLHIPVDPKANDVGDLTTMGRVLGRVWVGDVELSAAMVRDGFATREKQQ